MNMKNKRLFNKMAKKKIKGFFKKDINKRIEEAKEISVLFRIISVILMYVLPCIILLFINKWVTGNYHGAELEGYLKKEIVKACDFDIYTNIELIGIDKHYTNALSKDEVIFTYGTYKNPINTECNRIIAIFEKKRKSLVDFLLVSEPKYKISAMYVIENKFDYSMYFMGHDFYDFDNDGTKEIYFELRSNHADTISNSTVFLTHKNNKWKLVSPDFSELSNDIKSIDPNLHVKVFSTEILDIINNEKKNIYSLYDGGGLDFYINDLFNYTNFIYYIALYDSNNIKDKFAFRILKLNENDLRIDKSWNDGNIIILNENESLESYIGSDKSDDIIFYQEP